MGPFPMNKDDLTAPAFSSPLGGAHVLHGCDFKFRFQRVVSPPRLALLVECADTLQFPRDVFFFSTFFLFLPSRVTISRLSGF